MHLCLHTTYVQGPRRPGEGTRTLETRVADSCELPYVRWEQNLGPLQKHPVLLTTEHLSSSNTFSGQCHCSPSLFLRSHVWPITALALYRQLSSCCRDLMGPSPQYCLSGPLLSKLPSLCCKVAVHISMDQILYLHIF